MFREVGAVSTPRNPAKHAWLAWTAAIGLPVVLYVLYRMPPTEGSFYPRCTFNWLTGLHCPGCGSTRCLHALLHGDVAQAAAYNVLFLILLPYLVFWGARTWYAAVTGRPVVRKRFPPWSLRLFYVIILAYWILRNLNFAPFNLLAPHTL
jgi:hypothetical protein